MEKQGCWLQLLKIPLTWITASSPTSLSQFTLPPGSIFAAQQPEEFLPKPNAGSRQSSAQNPLTVPYVHTEQEAKFLNGLQVPLDLTS